MISWLLVLLLCVAMEFVIVAKWPSTFFLGVLYDWGNTGFYNSVMLSRPAV